MLAVTVTSDTSNLYANAAYITINGSGFDPIVANNSVTFDDGAAELHAPFFDKGHGLPA